MEKIAAAQVNQYLVKSAQMIRSLSAENKELRLEKEVRDRRDHAEKIASTALERGLMAEDEAKEYAESLANSGEDLKMVEGFVSRTAAGVPLGKLEKTASADNGVSSGEVDVLTAFLLSSEHAG